MQLITRYIAIASKPSEFIITRGTNTSTIDISRRCGGVVYLKNMLGLRTTGLGVAGTDPVGMIALLRLDNHSGLILPPPTATLTTRGTSNVQTLYISVSLLCWRGKVKGGCDPELSHFRVNTVGGT